MFGAFSEFPGSWQKEGIQQTCWPQKWLQVFLLLIFFFFFFSLIYFSLNQRVTGMYSVCAKFCAGHSDTKMGKTKSWAQDAQNVVGGQMKKPASDWVLGVNSDEEEKYRGKDDSNSAPGDLGRFPGTPETCLKKGGARCREARWRGIQRWKHGEGC